MTKDLDQHVGTDRVLETARCLLRHPDSCDMSRALSAFTSQCFPRELPLGQLGTAQEVLGWLEGTQSRWAEGSAYTWTVIRKNDCVMVGQVSLARTPVVGRWALAFWTHPECWGNGFATEAATGIVEFAFAELGASVVWAGAAEWNLASQHVLTKLGMAHVSDNPHGYVMRGEPIPTKEFEINSDAWEIRRLDRRRAAGAPR